MRQRDSTPVGLDKSELLVCYKISGRGVPIFAFVNNDYAGNRPATAREFEVLWKAQEPAKPKAKRAENLGLF
jgi:hypothetical protein